MGGSYGSADGIVNAFARKEQPAGEFQRDFSVYAGFSGKFKAVF
jgi:hypothetical protein